MSMLVCFAPGGFPGACHQIVNEQVAGGVPLKHPLAMLVPMGGIDDATKGDSLLAN